MVALDPGRPYGRAATGGETTEPSQPGPANCSGEAIGDPASLSQGCGHTRSRRHGVRTFAPVARGAARPRISLGDRARGPPAPTGSSRRSITAEVHGAAGRVGGRCWTIRDTFQQGQIAEHGGELIDTGHRELPPDRDDRRRREENRGQGGELRRGRRPCSRAASPAEAAIGDRVADHPHVELDALHHGPNWTAATAEELRAGIEAALAPGRQAGSPTATTGASSARG